MMRWIISLLRRLRAWSIGQINAFCEDRDFRIYRRLFNPLMHELNRLKKNTTSERTLIVCGRGMNAVWAQLWTLLSIAAWRNRQEVVVLSSSENVRLERFFRLATDNIVPIEALEVRYGGWDNHTEASLSRIAELKTFEEFKSFSFQECPVGQIALSTFSRHRGTGLFDLSGETVVSEIRSWAALIIKNFVLADRFFRDQNIRTVFMTEVFMEEYGAFYYAALHNGINVLRFAGTVRDNAIIVQHLSKENDRIHHASIARSSFEQIKAMPWTDTEEGELEQNFLDRYGHRWHRSVRNHPGTHFMDRDEMREKYGIEAGRKVAIIYSHILYDTLFFFGTDLFPSYADWLVESARAACANDSLDWFIKVHPSNIWRGELDVLLKGRYEEERLIERAIGKLPPHVRIIPADNDGISPLSWFHFGDFGITVRGTSGLEMAALGKRVVCAGTGRYEGNGFTLDPDTQEDYIRILGSLQDFEEIPSSEVRLAKQYAHAIFIRKPFELSSVTAKMKCGVKKVLASDDLVYIPSKGLANGTDDLDALERWFGELNRIDFLRGVDYGIQSK